MGKLIAKVRIDAYVDGERKTIQPGEPLPELPAHDVEQLKRMGAVEDVAETQAEAAAAEAALKRAAGEYEAARQRVQAAQASIAAAEAKSTAPDAKESSEGAAGGANPGTNTAGAASAPAKPGAKKK